METANIRSKPSCPKEFFAKLYGHLEDRKDDSNERFPEPANNGNVISKDEFKVQTLNENDNDNDNENENENYKVSEKKDEFQRLPPPFNFLPTVTPRNRTTFCTDAAFTAGFTAFREY